MSLLSTFFVDTLQDQFHGSGGPNDVLKCPNREVDQASRAGAPALLLPRMIVHARRGLGRSRGARACVCPAVRIDRFTCRRRQQDVGGAFHMIAESQHRLVGVPG